MPIAPTHGPFYGFVPTAIVLYTDTHTHIHNDKLIVQFGIQTIRANMYNNISWRIERESIIISSTQKHTSLLLVVMYIRIPCYYYYYSCCCYLLLILRPRLQSLMVSESYGYL